MALALQLPLPASQLLRWRSGWAARSFLVLVVLHVQIHGIPRHRLLRHAQKVWPNHALARHSSLHHAGHRLVGCQVFAERTRHFVRPHQHLRARHHVHLLLDGRHGSTVPKVLVVEEVFDFHSNDSVRDRLLALGPALLHRLRLPEDSSFRHVFLGTYILRALF